MGESGSDVVELMVVVVAGATRLELATSGVTGRRSNQLSYAPAVFQSRAWWAEQDSNL